MKKLILFFVLATLLTFSFGNAEAGVTVTPHVSKTTTWTACGTLLGNLNTHDVSIGAGECSPASRDINVSDFTIMSFGSIGAFGTGTTTGSGQFAGIVTTGGSLFGVEPLRWDFGFSILPKVEPYTGVSLHLPLSLGQ